MDKNGKKIKMVDIIRPEKKTKTLQESGKEPTKKEPAKKELKKELKTEEAIKISAAKPKKPKRLKILIFLFFGFLIYLIFWVLPRAGINITTKKTSLELIERIEATTNIGSTVISTKQIPAEIFSQRKNNVFSFLATGKKNVERKARGEVTIYNTYSSDDQPLIANTRLLTPDGKVFRLEKLIVVPGAKIIEGKIVSSSVKTSVVADKAGQEYNIGPVSHFTIPGFQGSEKYQSFYAKSDTPMTGGFVGEVAVPS
ncbi:hypothetical protein COS59_00465, partial [Candidatus Wolfebacteria bacterium CG03_land_8_20_14_0_80_36_15]